jgi:hypothetical protein
MFGRREKQAGAGVEILGLGQRARRHVGHAGEDGAINASARWVHPPTQPDKAAQHVCGPTQTDRFGRFGCPKWVGPLEMPSHRTPPALRKTYIDMTRSMKTLCLSCV